MPLRWWLPLVLSASAHAAVDYTRDIRPILETRCYSCHGPKAKTHGLRLDRKTDALQGGDSGAPAIVPGNSAASPLYKYVAGLDKDTVMPKGGPRLDTAQIALLKSWIDEGAQWPEDAVAVEAKPRRGENHWAFRPRQRPAIPAVKNRTWVRNPIDAFVLAKLEAQGWKPSPVASRTQLLRRTYLDITGLPPTLAEQQPGTDLDETVENLLARPTYSERWARHWLDLVRFAESNGYERDGTKPSAWKYRDYVIRAFASDKPFDRFIIEQLAGDLLPDANAETLIATGYHRLGPWDDEPADPATDRFDQLDDILSTTSQVFLGLTLGCARCHNHKFEPLTARDYYSMIAIFNGLERPRKGRNELDMPVGERDEIAREMERDRKIEPLEKEAAALREPFRDEKKKLPPDAELPADVRLKIGGLSERIAALKKKTPDLPRGYFLHELAAPKPTHLLIRGKAGSPGPETQPAVPAILVKAQPEFPDSQRRLAFAKWLADPGNPLTARVIVNRVWQQHFGEGLVRTPSDFGVMGAQPTHPELLDWLANWFVDNGWSFKKLHRLILTSNTWRMSKQWNEEYGAKDPENRLLWRAPYTRLEVEAIRDSMLAVSGRLNPAMFGPSMFPEVPPAALEGSSDPDKIWKASDPDEASRRTIYVFLKRSMIVPMLDVLDLCDTTRTSAKRLTTSVAPQALTLYNGDFVNKQARYFAWRLRNEAGMDRLKQIERAFRLALAREPKPSEVESMRAYLDQESQRNGELRALEEMCRVIFNLNEFVYTD